MEKEHQSLIGPDPLREIIEELFNGRVGSPPADQETIDKINSEGKSRFLVKTRP